VSIGGHLALARHPPAAPGPVRPGAPDEYAADPAFWDLWSRSGAGDGLGGGERVAVSKPFRINIGRTLRARRLPPQRV